MKVKLKLPAVFMLKFEYVKFDDSLRSRDARRAVDEIIAGTGRFRRSPRVQMNLMLSNSKATTLLDRWRSGQVCRRYDYVCFLFFGKLLCSVVHKIMVLKIVNV